MSLCAEANPGISKWGVQIFSYFIDNFLFGRKIHFDITLTYFKILICSIYEISHNKRKKFLRLKNGDYFRRVYIS